MCVAEGILAQWLDDLVAQEQTKRAGRTMLVWHANADACEKCKKFNGRRFSHVPDFHPLHPNCVCQLLPEGQKPEWE